VGELDGTVACEENHARMDVCNEERMPDTYLGEFVVAEPFVSQVARCITVLNQYRHSQ
jgi:hypothetical protein